MQTFRAWVGLYVLGCRVLGAEGVEIGINGVGLGCRVYAEEFQGLGCRV